MILLQLVVNNMSPRSPARQVLLKMRVTGDWKRGTRKHGKNMHYCKNWKARVAAIESQNVLSIYLHVQNVTQTEKSFLLVFLYEYFDNFMQYFAYRVVTL